jgi:hypothetical protein
VPRPSRAWYDSLKFWYDKCPFRVRQSREPRLSYRLPRVVVPLAPGCRTGHALPGHPKGATSGRIFPLPGTHARSISGTVPLIHRLRLARDCRRLVFRSAFWAYPFALAPRQGAYYRACLISTPGALRRVYAPRHTRRGAFRRYSAMPCFFNWAYILPHLARALTKRMKSLQRSAGDCRNIYA